MAPVVVRELNFRVARHTPNGRPVAWTDKILSKILKTYCNPIGMLLYIWVSNRNV
jgi:hypothetical protein